MVTVVRSGDLEVKSITIDPEAIDPEDVELLQDMVLAAVNEGAALRPGARGHQDGRPAAAASPGSGATSGAWACPGSASACIAARRPTRARSPSSASCRASAQRTAQRLAFHILRAAAEEALALADAIREVKERIGLCEVCFNLAEGPRCRSAQDERRDAGA